MVALWGKYLGDPELGGALADENRNAHRGRFSTDAPAPIVRQGNLRTLDLSLAAPAL